MLEQHYIAIQSKLDKKIAPMTYPIEDVLPDRVWRMANPLENFRHLELHFFNARIPVS